MKLKGEVLMMTILNIEKNNKEQEAAREMRELANQFSEIIPPTFCR